jgi:hypothetical protein
MTRAADSMDRNAQLAPLGPQRLRLLECLDGNRLGAPGYFDPDPEASIFAEFRDYAFRLSAEWAAETDHRVLSLLAAARLLSGELAAADEILDHLPPEPVVLDHGAGICLIAPQYALAAAMPIPKELVECRSWSAGSPQQSMLRDWLNAHRERLVWVETEGVYRNT